jgi:hypothetical protein
MAMSRKFDCWSNPFIEIEQRWFATEQQDRKSA